jgi:hypothetical protein
VGCSVENRKRLIALTEGNLRNHHLYITGRHDFFPGECYGRSNARNGTGRKLTLLVEGLPDIVEIDIAGGDGNGGPGTSSASVTGSANSSGSVACRKEM